MTTNTVNGHDSLTTGLTHRAAPTHEFVRQSVNRMLALQHELNARIDKNWVANNQPFGRAGWVECAEALDHFGWKWWKSTTPDMEMFRGEVVDLIHFAFSIQLGNFCRSRTPGSLEQVVTHRWVNVFAGHHDQILIAADELYEKKGPEAVRQTVEDLAVAFLSGRGSIISPLVMLCYLSGLSFQELFMRYVCKNILNLFRQDFGYKTGQYSKMQNIFLLPSGTTPQEAHVLWEDNQVLDFIRKALEANFIHGNSPLWLEELDIPRTIYESLAACYGISCGRFSIDGSGRGVPPFTEPAEKLSSYGRDLLHREQNNIPPSGWYVATDTLPTGEQVMGYFLPFHVAGEITLDEGDSA